MSIAAANAGSRRAKADVKRNLFGTVDHDQIRDDLHRELKLITEEKRRQWNFDFENFKPLRGRYKWERVGKRLQTRKSPTEITPTPTTDAECTENVFQQRSVDPAQATTRYNLRTRSRDLENITGFHFAPIDPARKSLGEIGQSPTENTNTGIYESKRTAKERGVKSTLANANIQRKTKIPPHLAAKKTRR